MLCPVRDTHGPYVSRDRNKGELRLRQRWECKPCTATKKRISRLRRLGRTDELDEAIEMANIPEPPGRSKLSKISGTSRSGLSAKKGG